MAETDFRNAVVGDRVWSIDAGWGKIIDTNHSSHYPINVCFDNGCTKSYGINGKFVEADTIQSLFWDEIKIIPPERPKRKVKKVVEGWVNIYEDAYKDIYIIPPYTTKEDADKSRASNRLGEACFIHHEYEVEE